MTVETATTIDTLNASYPSATDPKSEGDDHIRLIKTVLKATVVSGPASSTDNTLPRFDGTSGKLIQGSGVVVDDSNNLDVPGQIMSSTRGATKGFVTPDWRMYNTSSGNALAWNNGSDRMTLDASNNLTLSGGLFGYGAGAGGTVTQATSKATAVTLNKPSGLVTMHNAALAAGASVEFSLNNTFFGSNDTVVLTGKSWSGRYRIEAANSTGTVIGIRVTNVGAVSYSDPLEISFTIIKGSTT